MSDTRSEIMSLEERLRLAELGPDPKFFEEVLADQVVLMQDGQTFPKTKVVQAHQPGAGPKFTRVWLKTSDRWQIIAAAVST
jgi:hypothetical protein